jgi:hypothetical protein
MKKFPLILLALTMMACAPASFQPGASGFTPLEVKSSVISLDGPGVWYVKVPVLINVPRAARDDAFEGFYGYGDVNVGYKRTAGVNWVSMSDVRASEGWQVKLDRQEGSREIIAVRQDGNTRYYNTRDLFFVVLSVTIPNGTTPGKFPVIANLKSLTSSDTGSATFMVDVADPK